MTRSELIEKTYENLPTKAKESFTLNREYGLSYTQIAKLKGMTVKAVEYRIKTALKIFKDSLKDYMTQDKEYIIKVIEHRIPEDERKAFFDRIKQ